MCGAKPISHALSQSLPSLISMFSLFFSVKRIKGNQKESLHSTNEKNELFLNRMYVWIIDESTNAFKILNTKV